MTPSFRSTGILAGLALSALCALGFAQNSSRQWAARWTAEASIREEREAELDASKRQRDEEMAAMEKTVRDRAHVLGNHVNELSLRVMKLQMQVENLERQVYKHDG